MADKKSISQKVSELDQQIEWFYGDDFTLDQALDKYKKASQLVEDVQKDLDELKNQVEVIEDFTKE